MSGGRRTVFVSQLQRVVDEDVATLAEVEEAAQFLADGMRVALVHRNLARAHGGRPLAIAYPVKYRKVIDAFANESGAKMFGLPLVAADVVGLEVLVASQP